MSFMQGTCLRFSRVASSFVAPQREQHQWRLVNWQRWLMYLHGADVSQGCIKCAALHADVVSTHRLWLRYSRSRHSKLAKSIQEDLRIAVITAPKAAAVHFSGIFLRQC